MNIEVLKPECNLETVLDGRGGIFTWYPKEPIVEFNMIYFNPGKIRGLHYHPEFVEYSLVLSGNGTFVYRDSLHDKLSEKNIHLSKGTCVRIEKNTYHTIYSINEMTIVAMITKKWNDCVNPILRD
jgi:mannose-6-phosphate isomerase-like protein (cupin superfamily)